MFTEKRTKFNIRFAIAVLFILLTTVLVSSCSDENGPSEKITKPFSVSYSATVGGKVNGVEKLIVNNDSKTVKVTAKAEPGYSFICWSDGSKDPVRSDYKEDPDEEIRAYFARSSKIDFNAIYIYTTDGKPVLKKKYELMYGIAVSKKGVVELTGNIKGRGNSSWDTKAKQGEYASKNSYKLKLDTKLKLFDIGDSTNKDWVLNSNKFDASQLRNYFFWELADRMKTIPYVPDCTWAELYVNGEYRGLYMVSEFIEVANDRVDISETITKDDPSFLVETDFRGNLSDDPYFYIDGYGVRKEEDEYIAIEFVIKSNVENDSDIEEIKKYMEKCHEALMSGDRDEIDKLIDIRSLIDMYIIEELGKDPDMGKASFYIQREQGKKAYFTAPWDFDFTIGTYMEARTMTGLVSYENNGCPWFASLITRSWFRDALRKRMDQVKPMFLDVIKVLENKAKEIRRAADYSNDFWNVYGNQYHKYLSYQVSKNLNNYDDHLNFIENWLSKRWDNLYEIAVSGYIPPEK